MLMIIQLDMKFNKVSSWITELIHWTRLGDLKMWKEMIFFSLKRDNLRLDYDLWMINTLKFQQCSKRKVEVINHLGGGSVVRVWDQEVCFFCGLRFEPCGCSYDSHWRLTWSLTSGPVGLVEVRASLPKYLR
jgi:hypothetical protein